MNTEEMNLALAKWMGWTFQQGVEPSYGGGPHPAAGWFTPEGTFIRGAKETPDYSNDLNAVRTVEEKLNHVQQYDFSVKLSEILDPITPNLVSNWALIHATAAQKAEALVCALCLDKEGL